MELILIAIFIFFFGTISLSIGLWLGAVVGLLYGKLYYDQSEHSGKRYWPGFQKTIGNRILRPLFIRYFSFTIKKPALQLEKPVIYACVPHGLMTVGTILTFVLNFQQPPVRCAIHRLLFLFPILRDVVLWLGCFDASKENVVRMLTTKNQGQSIAIVPGGVWEMMTCLTESERPVHRGFLRIAFEHKVPVVPVYMHGEEDLFWVWDVLRSMRKKLISTIGYPFPSVFFGPLPRRLTAIMAPQAVNPTEYKTQEEFFSAYDNCLADIKKNPWRLQHRD
jgi:1-acyl-sn-glycerol-3-phosphate acyltransferase